MYLSEYRLLILIMNLIQFRPINKNFNFIQYWFLCDYILFYVHTLLKQLFNCLLSKLLLNSCLKFSIFVFYLSGLSIISWSNILWLSWIVILRYLPNLTKYYWHQSPLFDINSIMDWLNFINCQTFWVENLKKTLCNLNKLLPFILAKSTNCDLCKVYQEKHKLI